MGEQIKPQIKDVAETLLITLYVRALETRRPDALLRDSHALKVLERLDYDFKSLDKIRLDEDDRLVLILRNRYYDRQAADFIARNPGAQVVHIGCGLDCRFERVDDGRVMWYDLDLSEVMELRRKLIGGEAGRYHQLACSAFDPGWPGQLQPEKPTLVMAEGVFMYCREAEIRGLFLRLRDRLPGCEIVFDTDSPYLVRMTNLRFKLSGAKIQARHQWGLGDPRGVEEWGEGIRLLEAHYPLEEDEPRLAHIRWMRKVRFLARVIGIYRYRLGNGKNKLICK